MNSRFWNFGLIFLRSTFFSCNTFLYLWLSVWVDICIINFGNEGVRELAGPFQRSKPCGISKISNGFKFHFSQWKTYILPNSLINSCNLRKWNMSIMLRLKCDQPCVTSPTYFQQWNLNQDITFPNSSIDLKLGILTIGLYFDVFPNSQRDWKLGFSNVALATIVNFSQYMEEIENWDFEIIA